MQASHITTACFTTVRKKCPDGCCAPTTTWAAKESPITTPIHRITAVENSNPADGSYLNEFRMHEGVDTSYTKFHRQPTPIDDNPFDKVVPPADLLYVGWTVPGEWFNITVDVAKAGTYGADLLYTSNRGGTISIDVNGNDATGSLQIPTTYDSADPVAWRQWHHWNLAPQLFKVALHRGKNVLTVHILTEGNMNFAYFDFKQVH